MKNLFKIFLPLLLIIQSKEFVLNDKENDRNTGVKPIISLRSSGLIFETPDLTIDYPADDGIVHIEAYRTINNDHIIDNGQKEKYDQLKWVSYGSPKLIKMPSYENPSIYTLFHLTQTYFYVHFEMLTERDKEVLKNEVKRTKKIDVETASFVNLTPNDINCAFNILNTYNKAVILKGKFYDLGTSIYQIRFLYEKGNEYRIAFEDYLKNQVNQEELHIDCKLTSGAQKQKTNTFTLTTNQINKLNLVDKLFGNASEKFLTRDQMTQLSYEINNNFKVVENYQMSEYQFSKTFIESLIGLGTDSAFKPVSFEKALESLSKYSMNFKDDLKPDKITNEISNFFKIEQTNGKSHIIFDQKYYDELLKENAKVKQSSASAIIYACIYQR